MHHSPLPLPFDNWQKEARALRVNKGLETGLHWIPWSQALNSLRKACAVTLWTSSNHRKWEDHKINIITKNAWQQTLSLSNWIHSSWNWKADSLYGCFYIYFRNSPHLNGWTWTANKMNEIVNTSRWIPPQSLSIFILR